jgi:hypothetical protein
VETSWVILPFFTRYSKTSEIVRTLK